MARRTPPYRRVEALAKECARLLAWLRGPGASASSEEFEDRRRAYLALVEAVSMLPRGLALLRQHKGVPVRQPKQAISPRDATSFSRAETVLMKEPVLTESGWVCPAPLLTYVDELKAEAGSDQGAATTILDEAARSSGASRLRRPAALAKLKMRISRERKARNKPPP